MPESHDARRVQAASAANKVAAAQRESVGTVERGMEEVFVPHQLGNRCGVRQHFVSRCHPFAAHPTFCESRGAP